MKLQKKKTIWVLFAESLCDYELIGRRIMVFADESEARKEFKSYADECRKNASENGWEINETDDFFESYPEGSWGTSHETVELNKTVLNETVICRP